MPTENLQSRQGGNLPRPETFIQLIRFLAEESSQVIITSHAEDRMYERGITSKMLFDVLRKGMISGQITDAKAPGDHMAKVIYPMPNRRQVGVVTVVKQAEKLIIVTVEWEDGR